jgi:hypothetical protein
VRSHFPGISSLFEADLSSLFTVNKFTDNRNPNGLSRGVDQYCGNVLLKLNAKTNGVNSAINQVDLPGMKLNKTLMLGADVTLVYFLSFLSFLFSRTDLSSVSQSPDRIRNPSRRRRSPLLHRRRRR